MDQETLLLCDDSNMLPDAMRWMGTLCLAESDGPQNNRELPQPVGVELAGKPCKSLSICSSPIYMLLL